MKKQSYKKTTLVLPKDLWMMTKRRALSEDTSFRTVVREALAAHLGLKVRKGGAQC
jgi:hypothetical protein